MCRDMNENVKYRQIFPEKAISIAVVIGKNKHKNNHRKYSLIQSLKIFMIIFIENIRRITKLNLPSNTTKWGERAIWIEDSDSIFPWKKNLFYYVPFKPSNTTSSVKGLISQYTLFHLAVYIVNNILSFGPKKQKEWILRVNKRFA